MYPVGFLPPWAKPIAFVSPVVQVMQDFRAIIVGGAAGGHRRGRLRHGVGVPVPIGFGLVDLGFGLWIFQRESPWFAERV